MGLNASTSNGKPQSVALTPSSSTTEKGREQLCQFRGRDARALIENAQTVQILIRAEVRLDAYGAVAPSVLDRVANNVLNGPIE